MPAERRGRLVIDSTLLQRLRIIARREASLDARDSAFGDLNLPFVQADFGESYEQDLQQSLERFAQQACGRVGIGNVPWKQQEWWA